MNEIELPSGTIIYDVPDGVTQTQLGDLLTKQFTKRLAAGEQLAPQDLQDAADLGIKMDFEGAPTLPAKPPSDVPLAATGRPPEGPPGFRSFPSEKDATSLPMQVALGYGKSFYEQGQGLRGLIPSQNEAARQAIDESRKYGDLGPVGDVSRFATDIASSSLPAVGLLKGTQALNLGSRALQGAANSLPQIALGAAQGAAGPVGSGDSRLVGAALSGGGSAGGEALSGLLGLGKLAMRPTPAHQESVALAEKMGFPLDISQKSGKLNTLMRYVRPFAAGGRSLPNKQAARAEELGEALVRNMGGPLAPDEAARVAREGVVRRVGDITDVPLGQHAARGELGNLYGGQYDKLLRSRQHQITPELADQVRTALESFEGSPVQPSASLRRPATALLNAADPEMAAASRQLLDPAEMAGERFQDTRSLFSRAARKKGGEPTGRLGRSLAEAMTESFGIEYGPEDLSRLRSLDDKYDRFLTNKGALASNPSTLVKRLQANEPITAQAADELGLPEAVQASRAGFATNLIEGARDKATRAVDPNALAAQIGKHPQSILEANLGPYAQNAEDLRRVLADVIKAEKGDVAPGVFRRHAILLSLLGGAGIGGYGGGSLSGALGGAATAFGGPTLLYHAMNAKPVQKAILGPASTVARPTVNSAIAQIMQERNQ